VSDCDKFVNTSECRRKLLVHLGEPGNASDMSGRAGNQGWEQ
jgi:hypothetical protein